MTSGGAQLPSREDILGDLAVLLARRVSVTPGAAVLDLPGVVGGAGLRTFIYVTGASAVPGLVEAAGTLTPDSLILLDEEAMTALPLLTAKGWQVRRELRLMAATSVAATTPPELGLTVEAVSEANLLDAQQVIDDAFGLHVDARPIVEDPSATLLLARAEGVPVATAAWSLSGRGARISAVTTVESWRGRGFGGAMTVEAVRGALLAGAAFTYLEATPDGAGVYSQVGFVDLGGWTALRREG